MNGCRYRASLRDGRRVFVLGEGWSTTSPPIRRPGRWSRNTWPGTTGTWIRRGRDRLLTPPSPAGTRTRRSVTSCREPPPISSPWDGASRRRPSSAPATSRTRADQAHMIALGVLHAGGDSARPRRWERGQEPVYRNLDRPDWTLPHLPRAQRRSAYRAKTRPARVAQDGAADRCGHGGQRARSVCTSPPTPRRPYRRAQRCRFRGPSRDLRCRSPGVITSGVTVICRKPSARDANLLDAAQQPLRRDRRPGSTRCWFHVERVFLTEPAAEAGRPAGCCGISSIAGYSRRVHFRPGAHLRPCHGSGRTIRRSVPARPGHRRADRAGLSGLAEARSGVHAGLLLAITCTLPPGWRC